MPFSFTLLSPPVLLTIIGLLSLRALWVYLQEAARGKQGER
jgi:hypothetical protein